MNYENQTKNKAITANFALTSYNLKIIYLFVILLLNLACLS